MMMMKKKHREKESLDKVLVSYILSERINSFFLIIYRRRKFLFFFAHSRKFAEIFQREETVEKIIELVRKSLLNSS